MNKKLIFSVLLCLFSFGSVAGISVAIDASPEWAVEATRWTERLKQWSETARHYQSQIQAYKDQLATATGIRNIAAFTNELSNLQSELANIYKQGNSYISDFTSNPEGALSSQAKNLFSKYGAFNMCSTGIESSDNLCKARIVSTAASIEQGNEINKQLSSAMSQIQSLSNRIESSKDMKESQDLANALQAQSLKIQAIKMQYDVWDSKNRADAEMLKEQKYAEYRLRQKNAKIPSFE
ncbi:TPA: type IV secretion system protein [Escherichia coli]|nr:type IV secretion system protein [Escherichia coli]HDZ9859265.1 type IV secretion system protein [Escherichia coli]HEA5318575.1 type IV secretion system protein [Escherichia coli]